MGQPRDPALPRRHRDLVRDRRPHHRKPAPPPPRLRPAHPVGFKNATDGDIHVAINACLAAANNHAFLGITPAGTAGLITSGGNPDCHVVLRGGRSGTNFDPPSVTSALNAIGQAGLPRRVLIDASHGNSRKDHRRQPQVALAIADQIACGEHGIAGVMLESFLLAGRQDPGDPATLAYGQSVTDACIDFPTTEQVLETLAGAVRLRRHRRGASQ